MKVTRTTPKTVIDDGLKPVASGVLPIKTVTNGSDLLISVEPDPVMFVSEIDGSSCFVDTTAAGDLLEDTGYDWFDAEGPA